MNFMLIVKMWDLAPNNLHLGTRVVFMLPDVPQVSIIVYITVKSI
jgi:hypothetical protein